MEIVTPDACAFQGEVQQIQVEAYEGKMGVLEHHAPFVGMLREGSIVCDIPQGKIAFEASEGIIKIERNQVDIIVQWCRKGGSH